MALLTCGVTFSATAAEYIREVRLVGGTKSEVDSLKSAYTARGWTVVGRDLNAGCGSGSDYIYLLYKAEECVDGVNPGYITGFHISNAGGDAPDRITRDGRDYYLVPYEGGNHFVGHRGDLNSNAGGDDIHLYYTTDTFPGNYAVTDIVFNDTRSGAVGVNGGSEGYDLNSGCGSGTAYIYMHVTTAIIAGNGSGASASVAIDLTPGARTPAATELIRSATEWVEDAGVDAVAVVEVNGETLHTGSGAGDAAWSPQESGLYTLTHRVMSGDVQVGETLTATFYIGESESDIPTLGSGESASVAIDLTPGTRRAAATELIRYATEWVEDAGAGAVAVVEVNGETLYAASGTGVVLWSPQRFGTYTLTHRVMSGTDQVGETLTATFILENPYSATQTTAVPVPYVWLRAYYPAIEDAYEAYETAAKAPAANPRFTVEEAYVAGFDPTDPLAAFRAYIAVANDDVRVWWWPNLNTNGVNRVYKVWGKTNLTDTSDWMCPTNSSHRFFKVTVEMP